MIISWVIQHVNTLLKDIVYSIEIQLTFIRFSPNIKKWIPKGQEGTCKCHSYQTQIKCMQKHKKFKQKKKNVKEPLISLALCEAMSFSVSEKSNECPLVFVEIDVLRAER